MSASQTAPIRLYYWSTPNGRKISVALEELGAPYEVVFVDLGQGDQHRPEFAAMSPNHQIPVILDPDGPDRSPISIFESGAILMYLGRKFGALYPQDERKRVEVEQWLMWQMGDFGPNLGQAHHYNLSAPEAVPYAIERYHKSAQKLYGALDGRLNDRDFVAGEYSIADIAIFCWAARHVRHQIDLGDYPNVKRWYDTLAARPAVQRGMAIIKPGKTDTMPKFVWEKTAG